MFKMFGREQMCDPGNTTDNSTAVYLWLGAHHTSETQAFLAGREQLP